MDLTDLRRLFAYNAWANARLLDACEPLPPELFTRDLRSSFPSVRDTLAHLFGAEWVWLRRCLGESPPALPEPSRFPSVGSLRQAWDPLRRGYAHFLDRLEPDRLSSVVRYRNFRGEECSYLLHEVFVHVVNHATYHRGQVTTLLRIVGHPAVATDYLIFVEEGEPRSSTPLAEPV